MSYKDTRDYKNYPNLPGRGDISVNYDPGIDEGLIGRADTSGVGLPHGGTYTNRAWMNVDQFNYLAGRLNSITHIKPYTFNDYYEMFPYESGSYVVPKNLYSVEFQKNEEDFSTISVPADTLDEALFGVSGVFKEDVSATFNGWMNGSEMRRSTDLCRGVACEGQEPTIYITSPREVLFWYKAQDYNVDGIIGSALDTGKDYTYNFGVINHKTGWWIKRSPEGWEDFEQWESVDAEIGSSAVNANATGPISGNWWMHRAKDLGIPIKDETDLPNNYVEEMEKHNTGISIGNHAYDINVTKTTGAIDFSDYSCFDITGVNGVFNTDWDADRQLTGGFHNMMRIKKYLPRTTKCEPSGSLTYRTVDHYTDGRVSGVDWTYQKTPAHYSGVISPIAGRGGTRDADNVATNLGRYYTNRIAPASATHYDDLDATPDYFYNDWLSDVSSTYNSSNGIGDSKNGYIWNSGFYTDNDIYLRKGYGYWDATNNRVTGDVWTNRGGHQYVVLPQDSNSFSTFSDIGAADAALWNSLTGVGDVSENTADGSDKVYQNKKFEGVFAGLHVGYNHGEVYQKPILRGRHLLLNKEQSQIDGVENANYYGHNLLNKSRIHKNAYEILPYPPKKNLEYGLQDPTGATGDLIDPTRLHDPLNGFVKTYWLDINDVKNKAAELGFRFEFRRLTVPFKFKNFNFTYEQKAFMRESGEAFVNEPTLDPDGVGAPAWYMARWNDPTDCTAADFCAPANSGIVQPNTDYFPTTQRANNGVYMQVPTHNDGNWKDTSWPNFVDNNPWGNDLEDGRHKGKYKNPINAIYGDGYDSQNVIYHVDKEVAQLGDYAGGTDDAPTWNEAVSHGGTVPGTLTDDDKRLFRFTGEAPSGTFNFSGLGYRPILKNSKQFVWATGEAETEWVRPVGIQERYTYKYGPETYSYDIHVLDYLAEQAQLNDKVDPWRMESISTWSGNYIYAYENAAPRGTVTQTMIINSGYQANQGGGVVTTWPSTADFKLAEATNTLSDSEAVGHTTQHYKARIYLSMLSAYDQSPILKVSAANDYKEWLSNIVLNLYPKYYFFQEHSDKEYAKNHAMFVYKQPDVKYLNFPSTAVDSGHGYEISVLDFANDTARLYPLIWGGDSSQNPFSLEGETKMSQLTHAKDKRFISNPYTYTRYRPITNTVPSFYTDFWPRENIYASGGYVQNLDFTVGSGQFLNFQDELGTSKGYKAAIQWYTNNAVVKPTGEHNDAYNATEMNWTY